MKVAHGLHKVGVIIVRDPRVSEKANEHFIDLMEDYYEKTGEKYYAGETITDFHPEMDYLVGTTPEGIEHARDCSELVKSQKLSPENMP
jgi:hypothetical protein